MKPLVDGGKLVATCEEIRLPDDVAVGYLAEHVLGTPLTVVEAFHSHLEPLRMIR
jgi:fringe protein